MVLTCGYGAIRFANYKKAEGGHKASELTLIPSFKLKQSVSNSSQAPKESNH
jgi:hypothetical protein